MISHLVTVEEITVDRDLLLTTRSPSEVNLGGSHSFTAAMAERYIEVLRRAFRNGGRVFLLTWEGDASPLGADILGHIVAWTQHGIIRTATAHIGNYDRLVKFGGASGRQQKMLVYLYPSACPPLIVPSSV